ncbi:serine/threonine-protein kinase [Myxococcaceae bacterium GXIMD 01537]
MTTDETPTEDAPWDPSSGRPYVLFTVEDTLFEFIRTLERRENGELVLLAQRRFRQGLAGPVVIKRMLEPVPFERRQRLVEEVQLGFRLNHPGIARVHHLKMHKGAPHVILEYVDGPSLDTVVNLAAMRGRPMSTPFACFVMAEVAEALHHAHTAKDEAGMPLGIIHRDLSPRNIRIGRGGEVKLMSFTAAFSRLVDREVSPPPVRRGDVAYASPEYLFQDPFDFRADLFSLGLVLLELLTGRHPYDGDEAAASRVSPRAVALMMTEEEPSVPLAQMMGRASDFGPADVEREARDLPEPLKEVLHRALQRAPERRHGSALELRDALRAYLATLPSPYGRPEAALEVAQVTSEATRLRGKVELLESGLFPEGLEADEAALMEEELRAKDGTPEGGSGGNPEA